MTRPRVILADDFEPLLAALGRLVSHECEVVGQVSTVAELIGVAKATRPDIAIVDLTLPDGTGIEACCRLRELQPDIKVIIVTALEDADVRMAALEAGAVEYITKAMTHTRLLATIREIRDRSSAPG